MFYATVCWASNFNGGPPRLPPLSLLRISNPGRGVEPHSRVLTARMQSFSFVLRGEKSLRTADPLSARAMYQKNSQALSIIYEGYHLDASAWLFSSFATSREATLVTLHLYCLTGDNKSQEKSFCFRETFQKTLTAFFTVTFRIFRGHRCILNLPYVLRIGVVLFRSPSHQPSTSHHCVPCRWLGESRPST